MDASKIIVAVLIVALSALSGAVSAAPDASPNPLDVHFIKASNSTSTATVHFVLDENTSCDTGKGRDCLFSDNCSEPTQDICTKAAVALGTHKLEAVVDGQHLVAWVDVKLVAPNVGKVAVGECSVEIEDGKPALSCI